MTAFNLEVMEQAERYNRFLLGLVRPLARGKRVLDFGAGTGTFAHALAAEGIEVTGIEPDAALRSRLKVKASPDVREIASDSVDLVYSFNVLEHIEDDAAALVELRRVLRPGGRLLLYVPAFMLLYSEMDRRIGHLRRYRKAPLRMLVEQTGCTVDEVRYADSLGFLAALAYKALGARDGTLNPRAVRFYDRYVFPLSRLLDFVFHPVIGKNLIVRARKA